MSQRRVGLSKVTRTPYEFNTTPYVKNGENLIAVKVFKWINGTDPEYQHCRRMSGIFRNVYLPGVPKTHISMLLLTGALPWCLIV